MKRSVYLCVFALLFSFHFMDVQAEVTQKGAFDSAPEVLDLVGGLLGLAGQAAEVAGDVVENPENAGQAVADLTSAVEQLQSGDDTGAHHHITIHDIIAGIVASINTLLGKKTEHEAQRGAFDSAPEVLDLVGGLLGLAGQAAEVAGDVVQNPEHAGQAIEDLTSAVDQLQGSDGTGAHHGITIHDLVDSFLASINTLLGK